MQSDFCHINYTRLTTWNDKFQWRCRHLSSISAIFPIVSHILRKRNVNVACRCWESGRWAMAIRKARRRSRTSVRGVQLWLIVLNNWCATSPRLRQLRKESKAPCVAHTC